MTGTLSNFLKSNKHKRENVFYAPSEYLRDENDKPIEWQIRPLTSKETEAIRDECLIDVPIEGKSNMYRPKLVSEKYTAKLIAASVVFPSLHDVELQDSYGVQTPEDLLCEMIDNPGEYNVFTSFIQKFNHLDITLQDKINTVKN